MPGVGVNTSGGASLRGRRSAPIARPSPRGGFQHGAAGANEHFTARPDALELNERDVAVDEPLAGRRGLDQHADPDDVGLKLAHEIVDATRRPPAPEEIIDEEHTRSGP